MADAQATVERLDGEQTALEDRLSKMRAAHEQELRPYRRVMETSRGRASDASQTVAEVKRAVKGAEAQVKDATNARSQGHSTGKPRTRQLAGAPAPRAAG